MDTSRIVLISDPARVVLFLPPPLILLGGIIMVGQRLPFASLLPQRLVRHRFLAIIVLVAISAALTTLDRVVSFSLLNLLVTPAVFAFDLVVCLTCRLLPLAIVLAGVGLVVGLATGAWRAWDDQVKKQDDLEGPDMAEE